MRDFIKKITNRAGFSIVLFILLLFGLLIIIVETNLFGNSIGKNLAALLVIGMVVLPVIIVDFFFTSFSSEREIKKTIKEVEQKIISSPNEKAAAWELGRIKLESYLNRNLKQVQWIFIWTVMVMIAGFAIIGYGIMKAYEGASINASIITTSSGIIIEFIGATFLLIYKSTMQQAKDYVNVLERINAVGMSVQILDSISQTEVKLQDETKADIAKKLLELYGGPKT